MLEIILIQTIALSPNWEVNAKPTLPVQFVYNLDSNRFSDRLYLAKGKPYESDYSREVERERRRHQFNNLRYRDRRYYRDDDHRRRRGEEYRQESDRIYRRDRHEYEERWDDDRRRGSINSFEELEREKERLERQIEALERRLNLRQRYGR
ncbi:hypothetical protein [Myxosarcina sp. GI1(2024)]